MAAALVLTVVVAVVRPSSPREAPSRNAYWTLKKSTRGKAGVVIAGDSRVLHGVAPPELSEHLVGSEILNFGFSACGYSDDYLEAIGRALHPNRESRRLILLGITPHSLTRKAAANNGFQLAEPSPAWEAALRWRARALLERLDPLEVNLGRILLDDGAAIPTERERYHFYKDGWVSLDWVPPWPDYTRPRIPLTFAGNRVDPGRIDAVMAAVRAWTSSGADVFGFRPPTSPETAVEEDRASGFEEEAFVARFRDSGGRWIAVKNEYTTFDGSHLGEVMARQFSRDLAAALELELSR